MKDVQYCLGFYSYQYKVLYLCVTFLF